ncbi:hypothetical protein SBBP1_90017 [Burkholderiales bacterium]|nr:hypothetical protein SBBP1_90017 [Burkholderiales bacterium]
MCDSRQQWFLQKESYPSGRKIAGWRTGAHLFAAGSLFESLGAIVIHCVVSNSFCNCGIHFYVGFFCLPLGREMFPADAWPGPMTISLRWPLSWTGTYDS